MQADEILKQAMNEMAARGRQSVDGTKERSMAATVAAFNAVTGRELTELDGWLFMVMLKAVRTVQRVGSMDSFVDGAAYFALAGETIKQAVELPIEVEEEDLKQVNIVGKIYTLPRWANWIAQNTDGSWVCFEKEPYLSNHGDRWLTEYAKWLRICRTSNDKESPTSLHELKENYTDITQWTNPDSGKFIKLLKRWYALPDYAKWVAQDDSGSWFAYLDKPTYNNSVKQWLTSSGEKERILTTEVAVNNNKVLLEVVSKRTERENN